MPEADAERGEPVADVRAAAEAVRELGHQPHARRRERVPARDRAAVRVEARVVGRDADAVAPGQHLHRERLVELEQPDVVEREPGLREHALGRRHGPEPHQVRLDPGIGEADEPHRRLEPELARRRSRRRAAPAVAPSVSPAELPAVTRPPARNGVRSAASPSSVVSGRRNSSRSATRQPSSAEDAHRHDGVAP